MLALMFFALIVGGIILLSQLQSLRARVANLERQLQGRPSQPTSVPLASSPAPASAAPVASQPIPVQRTPLGSGTTSADRFINWIKDDWLLKLGAFLLLVGLSWLATYAFLNNWIGPMGRIALGLVAGTFFLALGTWRIRKFRHQGGIFLVLGSTTILVTIYAAREVYDFFTPGSALAVMFLSTAFVAFASVKHNSRSLALSSIILAGIAPVLTNSPTSDLVALFAYLLVVTIGAIWIVTLTGRRELTIAALALVTIYSLPTWFGAYTPDLDKLLLLSFAFASLFFITNSIGIIKSKAGKSVADLITAGGNGLFLLVWILTAAADEWKSLFICVWMIVFVVGAFLISRATGRQSPFYVYAAVGIAMLAGATACELHGADRTIAYTIECVLISLAAFYLRRDVRLAQRLSLLLLVPIGLSMRSIETYPWHETVVNRDFFVLAILALTLAGLGLFFRRFDKSTEKGSAHFNTALIVVGTIYAYALLWLALHAGLESPDTAVTTALFIYTIIGLFTYIHGRARTKKPFIVYGGLLLGFVVLRLLTVDVWKMELSGRIITFLLVGAFLMSTAFLVRKKQAPKPEKQEE